MVALVNGRNMAPLAESDVAYSAPNGVLSNAKLMQVKVKPNPVDELLKIKARMSKDQLVNFRLRYGDILDLLAIPVQEKAISVLSQHWDNQLKCFVFKHFHLSLVLEEYAGMLKLPLPEDPIVYVYPGSLPSRRAVAQFLGESLERIQFSKQGESDVIPLAYLLKYMDFLAKKGNQTLFSRALALAIYGIVLFPSMAGSIDFHAISVLIGVEHYGANPVPAILADTYLTLAFCRANEGGKLKCCLQLLTVWMANHFVGRKWSRGVNIEQVYHPLQDFTMREGSIFTELENRGAGYRDWVQFISDTPKDQVRWKLAWWDNSRVIYSCGDYPNVPLISARGVVNYNPSLAHMQLGYRQGIPSSDSTKPLLFFHSNQFMGENDVATRAWRTVYFKTRYEMGTPNMEPTADYEEWVKGYLKGKKAPTFVPPEPLVAKGPPQASMALKAEIENRKGELESILVEIAKEKEEYVSVHHDVTMLKRKRQTLESTDVDKLQKEIRRLKGEIRRSAAQKDAELKEAYSAGMRAGQDRIQELEELSVDLQNQSDLDHDTIIALKEEIDDLAGIKEEVKAWRNKHAQIVEWVNQAVPTFFEIFSKAERCMTPFYVPPALKDFLTLSRGLVKGWVELQRSV